ASARPEVHHGCRPLASAVHGPNRRIVKWRAKKGAGRRGVRVLREVDPGPPASLLLQAAQVKHGPGCVVQLVEQEAGRVDGSHREIASSPPDVAQRIEAPWPPIETDVVDLRGADAPLLQAKIDRSLRPARLMFETCEPLLL